jgi:hypothetical protein
MIWNLSKRGIFEVKSFYTRLITRERLPFPWKSIWRVKAPVRVAFFVWIVALGKFLTMDMLLPCTIVMNNTESKRERVREN